MRQRIFLSMVLVVLVGVAFGTGLMLVTRGNKLVSRFWGEAEDTSTVSESVFLEPVSTAGITKGVGEDGKSLAYVVSGRMLGDVVLRSDNLLQGKVVVEGHLQSQPMEFLAGTTGGELLFGVEQGGLTTFGVTQADEVPKYLPKNARVELTVQYSDGEAFNARSVTVLEDLAEAMREQRRYASETPLTIYALKVAVPEN